MLASSEKRYSESYLRTCIQCGNQLKSVSVILSDNTSIDQQCLNLIQKSITDNSVDEDMLLFHKYILSLVIQCKKCNSIIDGTIRKNTSSNYSSNPICSLCQPKKQVPQELKQCSSCEKTISQSLFDQPIEIEGMIFCQKCYRIQCQGYNPTYEVEKKPIIEPIMRQKLMKPKLQEKPDFGSWTQRNYFTNPRKEQEGPFQRCVSNKYLERLERTNYQTMFKREMPMLKFGSMMQLEEEKPMKMKKEKIECSQCQRRKELHQFKYREPHYSVCKECYKHNHSIKKVEVKKTETICGFGLDLLFKEEERPVIKPEKVAAQKIKVQAIKTQKTQEDSHIYNLKGCKVCINAESSMINIKCRHLMMCQKCFKKEQQRQGTSQDVLSCPYCKTSGRYVPYVEPIYV